MKTLRLNKPRALLTAILGLALALTACQPGPATAKIRPMEDVLATGPEFVNIGTETVTLKATTSVPLVCAVVYGETQDFGQMATDMDMAGGGHTDHHPTLTGLQPDTLYYARLQGVAADGTLYAGEVFTFTTSAIGADTPESNLALPENGARLAGVSSNYGGGADNSAYGALNAFDGDPGTAWSSDGEGDDAWIEIELAADTHVTRLGFWTRTMGTSAQIESFQIVTDRGETLGPFDLANADQVYYTDTDFTARRLRFEVVTSSGGNTGAIEIEVYGEAQS